MSDLAHHPESRWNEPRHDTAAFAVMLGALLVMTIALFLPIADGSDDAAARVAAAAPTVVAGTTIEPAQH